MEVSFSQRQSKIKGSSLSKKIIGALSKMAPDPVLSNVRLNSGSYNQKLVDNCRGGILLLLRTEDKSLLRIFNIRNPLGVQSKKHVLPAFLLDTASSKHPRYYMHLSFV